MFVFLVSWFSKERKQPYFNMWKKIPLLLLFISTSLLAQKYDAEIVNFNTIINYNGRNIKETYEYEIQINNGAGTKYAEIEIFYQQGNNPNNLVAEIYDMSGNKIRTLKKKEIINTTAQSGIEFHTDYRLLKFDLIHNRFPYIIKYSYSTIFNDFISLADWKPSGDTRLSTRKSRLTLNIPLGTPISINQHKVDSAQIVSLNDVDSYTWDIVDYVPDKPESFSPHQQDVSPYVEVMPREFRYGIAGNSTSWKEFGKWKYKLIEGLDDLSQDEVNKVHQLTDSVSSTKEKVKILYHYLQDNTRYILVSLDNGGTCTLSCNICL